MNILVIGGAGYIGSHTVAYLKKNGHYPVIFDSLEKGYAQVAQILGVPLYQGDLGDKQKVIEVCAQENIEAVMHFAAFIEVGESVEDPSRYYHNNVAKVLSLLDALIEAKMGYFVFSSTAATFGEPQAEKINEQHPQQPINPYGNSKFMVEKILKDYEKAYGLKSVILRYFNAAGSDEQGLIGESHVPETHLIPKVLMAAVGSAPAITVFGDDYATPDGTCIRDYVHVYDLASAHLLALEHSIKTQQSNNYNLGSGSGYSVKQIIQSAQKVTGKNIPITLGPRREGDPSILIADAQKAQDVLGWRPLYTLDQIISSAWRWEQERKY
ncbi:MAG: UDP-glucose 4-epimerase GalE [Spirochaetia bacterium]